ncbi:hypothetical protein [Hominifimenecus sp. rT4P-3]|uniref:hypothetical protein n=1 Tax=Hominifimenecus sp. rT4P-3 TaxID=3242979 RepID=UPI003DA5E735
MKYRFEVEQIAAERGKLPRDERHDIMQYFSGIVIEADERKKAARQLAKLSAGRLSKESTDETLLITLPDYGSCQVTVRIHAED